MTFDKKNIGFFIAFIIIGAVLGSALGTLLSNVIPSLSILNKNLTGAIGFNIEIISLHIKLTLAAIMGLVAAVIIFLKV